MNTDSILTRLLDRVDEIAVSVGSLETKTAAIVERLDKLNGSVARHEQALNETKLWQVTHEQNCKPRVADITIIKSVAMVCGTALTIYGAKLTGLAEALVSLLK